ncbi:sec-independent protein translocase protein TATB, chloroplastic isoform X2 [Manihot esculenta]|uniref:Sec-independent protein translocase protein TATB, chloroplastic n=2 Tax=Manihot esculenta TaxID=3983 RepID=A0A2C9VR56_MANES|nr:sec-independent protein translocase protein TATB, chloroplastic isoform X2 [Manihot esculenta]KAG8652935.1 hypothetical protein MANES_06G150900v8 [Manihot esculenta]OAY48335.1 hypothetical protein MANES_06G150900v8 [Manihot esculenta]
MIMAVLVSTPTSTSVSLYRRSSSSISYHITTRFGISMLTLQLGVRPFPRWSGLQHLGISITPKSPKNARKSRYKGKVVQASFFGVGAPEALVIGAVALLVFGPKELAEVARNLGKTLRAFQPTIRELQEVSREFKSSLEREISLDDISSQTQNTYSSHRANTASPPSQFGSQENSPIAADTNGALSQTRAYTSEDCLKISEEQLKASAAQQPGQTPSRPGEIQVEAQYPATVKETAGTMPLSQKPENEV